MKYTSKELSDMITATAGQKGKDRWYTANCPFCGDSQDATVLSSDAAAKAAAKGKIFTHITMTHKERVADKIETKA